MLQLDKVIYDFVVQENKKEQSRTYLGCSVVGKACQREVFFNTEYALNDIIREGIEPRLLYLFREGYNFENEATAMFTAMGIKVTDSQTAITVIEGFCEGHIDGIAWEGDYRYLLEFKTASDISFQSFKTKALKAHKPEYFYQVQLYMHFLKLTQCLFIVKNKNNSEVLQILVNYEEAEALHIIEFITKLHQGYVPPIPDWDKEMERMNADISFEYGMKLEQYTNKVTDGKGELLRKSKPRLILIDSADEAKEKYCKYCDYGKMGYCEPTKSANKYWCKMGKECKDDCVFCSKYQDRRG